jgi:hypothetical protein
LRQRPISTIEREHNEVYNVQVEQMGSPFTPEKDVKFHETDEGQTPSPLRKGKKKKKKKKSKRLRSPDKV